MRNLLSNTDATEADQKKIKLKIASVIGFGLSFSSIAFGALLLFCSLIFKPCSRCDGYGCWYCNNTYGQPETFPGLGTLLVVCGIITLIAISRFEKKHDIHHTSEGDLFGRFLAFGFILGFVEVFVSTNCFKYEYNGLWSFAVGKTAYTSAILAAVFWGLVLIIPVSMTIGNVQGSIESAESEATRRKNEIAQRQAEEHAISLLYQTVFSTIDCSTEEQRKRLTDYVKDAERNAIEEYHRQNNITMTMNSHSDLGICGISNTHFHFCLDETSIYHNYKDAAQITKTGYPLKAKQIPLDCITCFKIDGNLQYISNVQGGGVNLQGAAVGALIGGDTAAIIGSRIGTETTTKIVTKDDRKIIFYVKENGNIQATIVKTNNIDQTIAALRVLIPNKEESVVQLENRSNETNTIISSTEELKKYKELLDMGILSKEEFDKKKKQLLDL